MLRRGVGSRVKEETVNPDMGESNICSAPSRDRHLAARQG